MRLFHQNKNDWLLVTTLETKFHLILPVMSVNVNRISFMVD